MNQKFSEVKHLGIIMDGNRRWAKERKLPLMMGHQAGADVLKKTAVWCQEFNIKYLTVFCFSSENWQRPPQEVDYLINLMIRFFSREKDWVNRRNIKVRISGSRKKFSPKVRKMMKEFERGTDNNSGMILNLAVSYGGRDEIVHALKQIVRRFKKEEINEELISKNLWTAGLPDPDLIIRTGGEKRLSGFLLWQAAYAELYFSSKYWPDFTKKDLEAALKDYHLRQRRFGR